MFYLSETIFTAVLSEPRKCFSTHRLWIEQRWSLVNLTIVTKLQFIHIKQNTFTSADEERYFNENDTRINKNCDATYKRGNSIPKRCYVWPTLYPTIRLPYGAVHEYTTCRLWHIIVRHAYIPVSVAQNKGKFYCQCRPNWHIYRLRYQLTRAAIGIAKDWCHNWHASRSARISIRNTYWSRLAEIQRLQHNCAVIFTLRLLCSVHVAGSVFNNANNEATSLSELAQFVTNARSAPVPIINIKPSYDKSIMTGEGILVCIISVTKAGLFDHGYKMRFATVHWPVWRQN